MLYLTPKGSIWTSLFVTMMYPVELFVHLLGIMWNDVQTHTPPHIKGSKPSLNDPDRGTPEWNRRIDREYGLTSSRDIFRMPSTLDTIVSMLGGTLHLESRIMNNTFIFVPSRDYETIDGREMLAIPYKFTLHGRHHLMILRYVRVTTVFTLSQVQIGGSNVSTNQKLAEQLHALAYPTEVQEHTN